MIDSRNRSPKSILMRLGIKFKTADFDPKIQNCECRTQINTNLKI